MLDGDGEDDCFIPRSLFKTWLGNHGSFYWRGFASHCPASKKDFKYHDIELRVTTEYLGPCFNPIKSFLFMVNTGCSALPSCYLQDGTNIPSECNRTIGIEASQKVQSLQGG